MLIAGGCASTSDPPRERWFAVRLADDPAGTEWVLSSEDGGDVRAGMTLVEDDRVLHVASVREVGREEARRLQWTGTSVSPPARSPSSNADQD